MVNKPRYLLLKSFVSLDDQFRISREALDCHAQHRSIDETDSSIESSETTSTPRSEKSLNLALGIACGGNLVPQLPLAARTIQSAFRVAQEEYQEADPDLLVFGKATQTLQTLQDASTPLAGLALLYGPKGSMKPHYDSPTQPGQRQEWLACISLGATALFRCNDHVFPMNSGDVLVMDSMAVLHGVEQILLRVTPKDNENENDDNDDHHHHLLDSGLPPDSRLGILMWQGKTNATDTENSKHAATRSNEDYVDGIGSLFPDSEDEEEEE